MEAGDVKLLSRRGFLKGATAVIGTGLILQIPSSSEQFIWTPSPPKRKRVVLPTDVIEILVRRHELPNHIIMHFATDARRGVTWIARPGTEIVTGDGMLGEFWVQTVFRNQHGRHYTGVSSSGLVEEAHYD